MPFMQSLKDYTSKTFRDNHTHVRQAGTATSTEQPRRYSRDAAEEAKPRASLKEEDLFAHQERKDIPPDGNVYATIP